MLPKQEKKTIREILTSHQWKKKFRSNQHFLPCQTDDFLSFRFDYTYEFTDSGVLCNINKDSTGNWDLDEIKKWMIIDTDTLAILSAEESLIGLYSHSMGAVDLVVCD